MSSHIEIWRNVVVAYDVDTGLLYIRDSNDTDRQLGLFEVIDRD